MGILLTLFGDALPRVVSLGNREVVGSRLIVFLNQNLFDLNLCDLANRDEIIDSSLPFLLNLGGFLSGDIASSSSSNCTFFFTSSFVSVGSGS